MVEQCIEYKRYQRKICAEYKGKSNSSHGNPVNIGVQEGFSIFYQVKTDKFLCLKGYQTAQQREASLSGIDYYHLKTRLGCPRFIKSYEVISEEESNVESQRYFLQEDRSEQNLIIVRLERKTEQDDNPVPHQELHSQMSS